MTKYIFIKERDEENIFDKTKIVFEVNSEHLPSVIEEFALFLKGVGFSEKLVDEYLGDVQ